MEAQSQIPITDRNEGGYLKSQIKRREGKKKKRQSFVNN